ncbi:MAG TPA: hypothetical protein VKG82_06190, partial [Solirubrobacteraceae bacterium]|nr:hypothetical protein [Solirubrobacteraceae bacterium]
MSELLLAAPLRVEAVLIASAARGTSILKTGMGPARARASAGALRWDAARALLVVGFCGGLDEESAPGEVIIPEQVYPAGDEGHPEGPVSCDLAPALVSRLAGRGLKLRNGPIVCVSRIAVGERREQLLADGAIAVDMESVWLAEGARGRPFGV